METHEQAVKRWKKSRKKGGTFENKVREDLTNKGWIVCRFDNNVDLKLKKLVQSKGKFNPFTRSLMMINSGFPDYLCFKFKAEGRGEQYFKNDVWNINITPYWEVKLVECKVGKYLDAEEKEKVEWIKQNLKIPICVAYKERVGRRKVIIYKDL